MCVFEREREREREREMAETSKPKTIKLWCPSLSKLVPLVAWEEQKLDLGSISRAFGLDPSTVKLNGHFVSRGVDLVSSSVTWRSLLSFFSARGLSTGKDYSDALTVDGKLCKVGTKRALDPQDTINGYCNKTEARGIGTFSRSPPENTNLLNNKRFRDSKTGCEGRDHYSAYDWNGLGLKRRHLFEDLLLLKKLKINETDPCI
ncbi:hypothetical protein CFOL_v3_14210 [Cephalotus follicularis]|uniref:Uncharacterized protein n=1 Tax=Cephalotus follicularis TaxID=3775 RepID=A0A1Q3BS43_CEPFO|nr:hypothetical protein CFOL_v3_14210 [Cephalotus follicularis]